MLILILNWTTVRNSLFYHVLFPLIQNYKQKAALTNDLHGNTVSTAFYKALFFLLLWALRWVTTKRTKEKKNGCEKTDGSLCIVALLYIHKIFLSQHKICIKSIEFAKIHWTNVHCKKGQAILSKGSYFTSPLWKFLCLNHHLASVSCPQWLSDGGAL